MPKSKRAPARADALVLVDVINGFDFEGSGAIVKAATRAAPKIEALAQRARARKVPVIYVNDNFGHWRSDFEAVVAACMEPDQPGRHVTERLRPERGDFFVLKPRHSGFYLTPLDLLLRHLDVDTIALAGFATNLCVVFTANDAHVRGYRVIAPSDCTGSNSPKLTRDSLNHIKIGLTGTVVPSAEVQFKR